MKEEGKTMQWKKLLLLIAIFITGQQGFSQIDGKVSLDFPSEDNAMQAAKETVKAYETGNWEMLRSHVQRDAYFYNLGSFDSLSLDQTINYWKKGRESATPLLAEDGAWLPVSVPEGPRKGNWILHWGTNTLSYPNGETISFPYHVALKFQNNKVNQAHFYYDNNRIIRALGYEIQPPFVEPEAENEDPGEDDEN